MGPHVYAELLALKRTRKADFKSAGFSPPDTESTSPIPPVLQKHKAALDDYHAKCCEAANRILDLFSIALNLPKTYFRERHSPGYNRCAKRLLSSSETSQMLTRGDACTV